MVQTTSWTKGNGSVHVFVADSTPLTGRLIADSLRRDRTFDIIDASASLVLPMATSLRPEVAIISGNLEGVRSRGFEILKQLRAAVPKTRTIMLLDSGECNLVVEAFRSGARGVFCRHDPLKMLSRCVHKGSSFYWKHSLRHHLRAWWTLAELHYFPDVNKMWSDGSSRASAIVRSAVN